MKKVLCFVQHKTFKTNDLKLEENVKWFLTTVVSQIRMPQKQMF